MKAEDYMMRLHSKSNRMSYGLASIIEEMSQCRNSVCDDQLHSTTKHRRDDTSRAEYGTEQRNCEEQWRDWVWRQLRDDARLDDRLDFALITMKEETMFCGILTDTQGKVRRVVPALYGAIVDKDHVLSVDYMHGTAETDVYSHRRDTIYLNEEKGC